MDDISDKIIEEIGRGAIEGEKDYYLFHRHRFDRIFELLQRYGRDSALLDIGSHYLHGLLGAHLSGYKDLSGIDLALFNAQSAERAQRIGAVVRDCDLGREAIPFPSGRFDVVLLSETLEHFNFHPKMVFHEIARVLKPGGEAVITTPNLLRINNRLKCVLGRSINADISEEYTPGTHYREYSLAEIEYLLAAAGMETAWSSFADFDYPGRGAIEVFVNKAAGAMRRSMKGNLIVIGKKPGSADRT